MKPLVTRAYNSFTINKNSGTIRKISSTERLRDEIWYYQKLNSTTSGHPEQAILFPRILGSVTHTDNSYWMDLELYDYPNLGAYLFGNHIMPSWSDMFTKLRDIIQEWSTISPYIKWTNDEIRTATHDMYITKTEREYSNFYDGLHDKLDCIFDDQISSHTLVINEKEYHTFEVVWPKIKEYIETHMLDFTPSLIHGDCCFSNILYGENRNIIRFIDPRGSFGKIGIYGDSRYDIAKLYHSVDGTYEAFITDNFTINSSGNVHEFVIKDTSEVQLAKNEFEEVFFPQHNKKEIKILQGCIFIGMCARHFDSVDRQHAMYLTGIKLLNEAVKL